MPKTKQTKSRCANPLSRLTGKERIQRRNLKRRRPTNANLQNQNLTGSNAEKKKRLEGEEPLNVELIKADEFNIKTPDDELDCFITGADVTADGRILLVDYHNRKLKLFSKDKSYLNSLTLPYSYHFYGLTALNDEEAIVSVHWDQCALYVIDIKDELSVKTKIQFDYLVMSVTSCQEKLIVSCWSALKNNPTCVKLIDTDGMACWSKSNDYDKTVLECVDGEPNIDSGVIQKFDLPSYATCFMEKGKGKVVVSDKGNNTITKLDAHSGEIEKSCLVFSDIKLEKRRLTKAPSGITTDINGNHYVCYSHGFSASIPEVIVWTSDLEHHKVVLSSKEGLDREPYIIKYHQACNEFLISYHSRSASRNVINCFQYT